MMQGGALTLLQQQMADQIDIKALDSVIEQYKDQSEDEKSDEDDLMPGQDLKVSEQFVMVDKVDEQQTPE